MPYRWEPNAGASGRYRDERGRFVASSTVRRELDRYLDNSDPAKALAEALRARHWKPLIKNGLLLRAVTSFVMVMPYSTLVARQFTTNAPSPRS